MIYSSFLIMFVLLPECVLVWLSRRQLAGVSSVFVFCPQDVAFRGATRSSINMYLHSFHTLLQHYWDSWLRNNLYDCSILIIAHFLHCRVYNYGHLSCLMLLSSHLLLHSIRKCSLVTPLCSCHDISLPSAHRCCVLLNFLVHCPKKASNLITLSYLVI